MKKTQIFNQVPIKRPKRSFFDLSHEVKMSGKFSYLYPILVQEALPGDSMQNTSTVMLRFAPMLAPIMHRIDVTTHYFFVPYRILIPFWEDFITAGQDGDLVPVLPYMTPAILQADPLLEPLMQKGTLWDYLGLPVKPDATVASSTEQISMLPFYAFTKIWSDYYRDPNFDTEIDMASFGNEGENSSFLAEMGKMRRRAWAKDYFTACLPFAQRGESVLMPLSGTGFTENWYAPNIGVEITGANLTQPNALGVRQEGLQQFIGTTTTGPQRVALSSIPVTLNDSSVTINDLRTALAIQWWMENNARGGARYIEQIESHFAVRVPDYRLQRSEYLGGGKQPVQISEVLATSKADTTPIGDMAGHGISVGKSNRFTYRCQEHGIILGIMSVVPIPAYQQGIDRMWSRREKFDFAWPELAHLGEQEVLSKEVFYSYLAADDDENNETFGYIPRYAEYKFKQDRVAGDFRDNLAFWHLGRIFTARPGLNALFTTTDEEGTESSEDTMRRIFAVEDGTDYLWIDIFHRFTAKRPLPYFGVPRLIG